MGLLGRTITSYRKRKGPLLPRLFLRVRRAQRILFFRDFQQRWVKLHEGGIHRAVLLVTGVAVHFAREQLSRHSIIRVKEGPLSWKPRFIPHMQLEHHLFYV